MEVSTTLRGAIKPSSGERFKLWISAFFPFYSTQETIFCLMTSLKSEAAEAETLTTLVLKHRETRHDIPRGCMMFIVKIILNFLCLVMTLA